MIAPSGLKVKLWDINLWKVFENYFKRMKAENLG